MKMPASIFYLSNKCSFFLIFHYVPKEIVYLRTQNKKPSHLFLILFKELTHQYKRENLG